MNESISPSSKGKLIVKVSTANGAIPLENVTVIVQGQEETNQDIFYSLLTNSDGLTKTIELPTKPRSIGNAPPKNEKPYLTYTIDVYKDGYYPQHYNGVPIFENILAIQNAKIIPSSEFDAPNPYTNDGQIFNEEQNSYL